jgi:hypothetical protein
MHKCGNGKVGCVQNEKSGNLIVYIESRHFEAKFCPYCGFQPERSKREDDIMYLFCGICNDYYHVFIDKDHISRCGALNPMET